jgi:protein ImuB
MSKAGELYACIYAREFPAQAMLRLRADLRSRAVVVLEGEPPIQHVCALNGPARSLGVLHGMTRVEMDAFEDAVLLPRSMQEEAVARAAVFECAGTFSPRMEDKSNNTSAICVVDIAGTEKLFGSPESLGKNLLTRAKAIGITASVAISSNFEAAICFAHFLSTRTGVFVIPPEREAELLARLPLSVLELSPEHAEILFLWGITTLGGLANLPEMELVSRLGQQGKRLRQLARGESPHLFTPMEPALLLEERIELDTPIENFESLLFVAGVMLDHLIARASNSVLALAAVTITLILEGGGLHTRTVRPALPANDRKLWLKLFQLDLQAHPPAAAVLLLVLSAEPGNISKVQLGLFTTQAPEPGRLDVTLARIRSIVGENNVGRAILKDTHRPDAFRMEPFSVPTSIEKITQARSHLAVRQLRPPAGITVTLRNRQPENFVFRERRYMVEQAYGPWYVSGDWWSPTLWSLERWDLVARAKDGQMLCCCVTHDLTRRGWQMESLYD